MRLVCIVLCLAGCSTRGSGTAQVFIAAEDTIPDGLEPGNDEENVRDGWMVTYDKFLLAIGNFRATRLAEPELMLSAPAIYVLDMKALPTAGFVLATFTDAADVRYDKVGFDIPNASASALKADVTSQADYAMMVSGGYSVYFEATLERAGVVQTVKWGVPAGTAFDDCAPPMGDAGFAVPSGGTVQVKPTVHGDHWFFTNITQGSEMTERRAQWIIDCDLDGDRETTLAELKMCRASDVFRAPTYNLSGGIIPILTAYDYLIAQASTLGDFQGEGECPTRKRL